MTRRVVLIVIISALAVLAALCLPHAAILASSNPAVTFVPITTTTTPQPAVTQTTVPLVPLPSFKEVAAGAQHTCAVTTTGALYCWGRNDEGQLGIGTTTYSSHPVLVSALSAVQSVALGEHHSCAITTAGALWCWGQNKYGELGNGTKINGLTPAQIKMPTPVKGVAPGGKHTCTWLQSGDTYCWGSNAFGQLGFATSSSSRPWNYKLRKTLRPTKLAGLNVTLMAASSMHTCAVASGALYCWGQNSKGQLGTTGMSTSVPQRVQAVTGATSLALGVEHTCVLQSGTVSCFGKQSAFQLSAPPTTRTPSPTTLKPGSSTTSSTTTTTIAPTTTTPGKTGATAQKVTLTGTPTFISSKAAFTCAVVSGNVQCWGSNTDGTLGRSSRLNADGVGQVAVVQSVASLAVGQSHACVVTTPGALYCWGSSQFGQSGSGVTSRIDPPRLATSS